MHGRTVLLVIAGLVGCGRDSSETCYTIIISYSGTRSGQAYAKMVGVGDNAGSFIGLHADSIQQLEASFNTLRTCYGPGVPLDRTFDAAVWIDVSGMSATNCANLQNSSCQPASVDPQVRQQILFLHGQFNLVRLNAIDPP
jgi:hypothetical protein